MKHGSSQTQHHTLRPDGYGGAAICAKDSVPSTLHSERSMCTDKVEICTVKVTVGSTTYIINSLYRPHSKHHQINGFTDFMKNLLSHIFCTKNKTIICWGSQHELAGTQ